MVDRKKRRAPPAFIEAARRCTRERNALQHLRPKCGAIAKSTGKPCGHPAMENGRCQYHGGKTPKGKDWHRVMIPANPDRATAKIQELERRAEVRAKRLVSMSPEDLAAYREWQNTHAPGPPEGREARRQIRKQNADMRERWAAQRTGDPTPEIVTLRAEREALRARLEALEALPVEVDTMTDLPDARQDSMPDEGSSLGSQPVKTNAEAPFPADRDNPMWIFE